MGTDTFKTLSVMSNLQPSSLHIFNTGCWEQSISWNSTWDTHQFCARTVACQPTIAVPRLTPGISMAMNRVLLPRPLISHKRGLPHCFHMQEKEMWTLVTHKEFTSVVLLYSWPLHYSSAEYWVTIPKENVWTWRTGWLELVLAWHLRGDT